MRVSLDSRWRVDLRTVFELPFPRERAWSSLRDFRRFACLDAFHVAVHLDRDEPAAGVGYVLEHRLAGLGPVRFGRILSWDEGTGYSFSDLSRLGPRHGFPHVFTYRIESSVPEGCRFELRVRGLWTLRALPRPLVRLWLAWNLLKLRLSIRNAFLSDAASERSLTISAAAVKCKAETSE